jgi:hypothetical protein
MSQICFRVTVVWSAPLHGMKKSADHVIFSLVALIDKYLGGPSVSNLKSNPAPDLWEVRANIWLMFIPFQSATFLQLLLVICVLVVQVICVSSGLEFYCWIHNCVFFVVNWIIPMSEQGLSASVIQKNVSLPQRERKSYCTTKGKKKLLSNLARIRYRKLIVF